MRRVRHFLVVAVVVLAVAPLAGCGDDGDTGASAPDTVHRSAGSVPDADPIARAFKDGATPLVRTDFTDDGAWNQIRHDVVLGDPTDPDAADYEPNIEPVEDTHLAGVSASTLAARWDRSRPVAGYLLLADATSMREELAGKPVTLVYEDLTVTAEDTSELGWTYGRTFRCAIDQVASTEANLSLANMDFSDFADAADKNDGIFDGFDD